MQRSQRVQRRDKNSDAAAVHKPRAGASVVTPPPPTSIFFYGPLLAKMPDPLNSVRRSSRLNKQLSELTRFNHCPPSLTFQPAPKNNAFVELPGRTTIKKRKIVQEEPTLHAPEQPASSTKPPLPTNTTRPPPAASLNKREKVLLQKEKDLQRKSEKLNERMLQVSKMEQDLVCQVEVRDAKAALTQLEEHFICSLCYDVM
jgi:hypothetical protein